MLSISNYARKYQTNFEMNLGSSMGKGEIILQFINIQGIDHKLEGL